jgi:hypothetical protein
MNTDSLPENRDTALRSALVATVNLSRYSRRRPNYRIAGVAIAAFALAGALTGGAVAYASTDDPAQRADEAAVRGEVTQWAQEENATLLSEPIVQSGSGTTVLQLGPAPAGADIIIEGLQCTDAGTFTEALDAADLGDSSCTKAEAPSLSSASAPVTGHGNHTFTVTSPNGARYSIAVAWAKSANLKPSAAQQAELADGVVTRAEDIEAYNRYSGCMAALGQPIDYAPTTTVVANYALPARAVDSGADNRCYVTEYKGVDAKWQLENEQTDISAKSLNACLLQRGVQPAADPTARFDQLQKLGAGLTDCIYIG